MIYWLGNKGFRELLMFNKIRKLLKALKSKKTRFENGLVHKFSHVSKLQLHSFFGKNALKAFKYL
jgi:hypothetical protein